MTSYGSILGTVGILFVFKVEGQVLVFCDSFSFWGCSIDFIFPHECSKEKCRLLVTHDDYSISSRLPRGRTSVVTILRNPIDRVFSTYEFSVEVAARFLVHPNLTSATQMTGRLRSKNKGVSTLDIWPWKYLVPWMQEDLFARVCFLLFALYSFFTVLGIRVLSTLCEGHCISQCQWYLSTFWVKGFPREPFMHFSAVGNC